MTRRACYSTVQNFTMSVHHDQPHKAMFVGKYDWMLHIETFGRPLESSSDSKDFVIMKKRMELSECWIQFHCAIFS